MEELITRLEAMERRQEAIFSMLEKILNGNQQKEVMNTAEVAEYIGVTPGRIRNLVHEGNIPYHKNETGTRNFFRREEIDTWRTSRRFKTNTELLAEVS